MRKAFGVCKRVSQASGTGGVRGGGDWLLAAGDLAVRGRCLHWGVCRGAGRGRCHHEAKLERRHAWSVGRAQNANAVDRLSALRADMGWREAERL